MEKVNASEVLTRAADLLEEFGWQQGRPGSKEQGAFCMRGALAQAHTDLTGEPATWFGDQNVIGYDKLLGGNSWIWNDNLGRTKAEVVAKLRAAADKQSAPALARLDRSLVERATSPETVVSGGG